MKREPLVTVMLLETISGECSLSVRADDIPMTAKTLTNTAIKRPSVRFTPKTKMVLTNCHVKPYFGTPVYCQYRRFGQQERSEIASDDRRNFLVISEAGLR